MISALNKLIHILLDYPKIILSVLVVITILLGTYLSNIRMDFSIEQLFSQNDPVLKIT